MLGGRIDWAGLPIVAELLGLEDLEMLIMQLNIIAASQDRRHG